MDSTATFDVPFVAGPSRSGPLTWGQLAIWDVLHWLAPDDTTLTISRTCAVPPGTGVEVVGAALRVLVERHESLRSVYAAEDGEPRQTVMASGCLTVGVVDTGDGSVEATVASAQRRLRDIPFDMSADLPIRAVVVTRSGVPVTVILSACHMAVDAWSFQILLEDLAALLAVPEPSASVLPEPGQQPLDRLSYERSDAGRRREQRAISYWDEHVRQTPSSMLESLPPPVAPNLRWARIESEAVAAAVRILAERERVSASLVVMAAIARLLARYKDEDRVSLRLIVATRFKPDVRRFVGAFNQNALFHIEAGSDPFATYLRRAAVAAMQAYGNCEYDPRTIESLVSDAATQRGLRPDGYCFFNDMSARGGAPGRAGDEGPAASPEALLDRTKVSEFPGQMVPKGATFFVFLMDIADRAVVEICVDHRFLAPRTVTGFLRDLEALLVGAVPAV